MRLFYMIAALLVVAMALSPFWLLKPETLPTVAGATTKPGKGVVVISSCAAKVRPLGPALCGDTASATVQGYVYEGLNGCHYGRFESRGIDARLSRIRTDGRLPKAPLP